jgi:hypothetical protein
MITSETLNMIREISANEYEYAFVTNRMRQFDKATEALCNGHRLLVLAQSPNIQPYMLEQLITDYAEYTTLLDTEFGIKINKTNVSTESVALFLHILWEKLVKFVQWIIGVIVDFFKRIFSRKYRLLRNLNDYAVHFKSHPVDNGTLGQHYGTNILPCDILEDWVLALYRLSMDLAPMMSAFESRGQLTMADLSAKGIDDRLTKTGLFDLTTDAATGCIIITPQILNIENKKVNRKLGDIGWSSFSIGSLIEHTNHLLESVDVLKDAHRTLKKSMLDNIQDHVNNEESHGRYVLGVKSINQVVTAYGAISMTLAAQVVQTCSIAKRYCK